MGNPPAPGTEELFYPGELEAHAEARNRKAGIVIPEDTLAELDAAALDLGIPKLRDFAHR